jgi:lipopolysaccharide O-acetyltransferase
VIGEHVLFGSKVYVSDHNHGNYRGESPSRPDEPPEERPLCGGGPVTIGANVWIGENVVIIGPASIGFGAIIGANSLVRGEVPPNCVVAGNPAKVTKVFNFETGHWDKA